MINKELQVVVAGHICFDVIPAFIKTDKTKMEEIFIPGKLINMGSVKVSTGGPVSNTGIALGILGINTKLMGKIGSDYFGEGVLKLLKERNAEDGMVVADGEETSYTVVIVPPGFDRIFLHNPGANNTFCSEDINYYLVKQAKLFHFGYPPLMRKIFENDGEELVKIFKKVKELGVTTSLDMSLPDASSESGKVNWENVLRKLLPYVDIYIPSVEESMFMILREEFNYLNQNAKGHDILENLDINKLQGLGEKLVGFGPKILVLKCGVKGYYIRTQSKETLGQMGFAKPADLENWASRELHEESFHVPNVAAATGSGDSSIAGFLAAFLNGKTIEESIRIACAVGGQNVQVFDALSGIKTWDETMAMIPGWQKNRLSIGGSYWRFDDNKNVWVGGKDAYIPQ
ncbi:MAG: carbohydrate kinase family protein [Clostridiales bacterium]|nr:carbohydrate kinase family protein [Clostridiales bacterium]